MTRALMTSLHTIRTGLIPSGVSSSSGDRETNAERDHHPGPVGAASQAAHPRRFQQPSTPEAQQAKRTYGTARAAIAACLLLALSANAQPSTDTFDAFALGLSANLPRASGDTSHAALTASLAVETARLDLARSELRAVSLLRRLRPKVDVFGSVSARGYAFPAISSQGYDPAHAAVAQWPGDTWGVTVSWSLDQLLDRQPLHRARANVRVAHARLELATARHQQQASAQHARMVAEQKRQHDERRAAQLVATQLHIQRDYLARKLLAHTELLRLAEMQYQQGELDYAALAQARLSVLSAEHASATNAAQLAALGGGASPDQLVRAASSDGGR